MGVARSGAPCRCAGVIPSPVQSSMLWHARCAAAASASQRSLTLWGLPPQSHSRGVWPRNADALHPGSSALADCDTVKKLHSPTIGLSGPVAGVFTSTPSGRVPKHHELGDRDAVDDLNLNNESSTSRHTQLHPIQHPTTVLTRCHSPPVARVNHPAGLLV